MAMSMYDRTVSGFPLSISTALAFESLFPPRQDVYDPERNPPEIIDITPYNQLWVNVETLFRNMMQSAPKEAVMNTGYRETSAVIVDEMDTIVSLLENEGGGRMAPIFYVCDYAHALRNVHKAFSRRSDSTANQIHYTDLKNKTFKELKNLRSDIKFFPSTISADGKASAMMLTHIPYDLLARRYFSKLDLLESNTGKLKKPQQWASKYYPVPKRDMSILPFNRPLLMALGDKVLLQPMPIKIRNQIMDTATNRKWTPMTTLEKCMLDLSIDMHPFDYSVIDSVKGTA